MQKIIICVHSDYAFDQRVQKIVCTFLKHLPQQIVVLHIGNKAGLLEDGKLQFYRIPTIFRRGFWLYAELQFRFFFKLMAVALPKDVIWCCDVDILLGVNGAAKWRKSHLIVDLHEIFSELPSVQGRCSQKVWRWVEQNFLPKAAFHFTVSESYAEWYREQVGISPVVLPNYPRFRKINEKKDVSTTTRPYLIYQGSLEKGRGIERMIAVMQYFSWVDLKLFGSGPYQSQLENFVQTEGLKNIHFMGKVAPDELWRFTCGAVAGFSLEDVSSGESYRRAAPNKLFDYIQAEIPVIATPIPEYEKVFERFKIGYLVREDEELKFAVEKILQKGKSDFLPALLQAKQEFCLEKIEQMLVSKVKNFLTEN